MYIDGTVIGVWALATTALVMAMAAKVKFDDLEDEITILRAEARGWKRAADEDDLTVHDLIFNMQREIDEMKEKVAHG